MHLDSSEPGLEHERGQAIKFAHALLARNGLSLAVWTAAGRGLAGAGAGRVSAVRAMCLITLLLRQHDPGLAWPDLLKGS